MSAPEPVVLQPDDSAGHANPPDRRRTLPRRYEELQLRIKHSPLDLAVALARAAGPSPFMLYEDQDRTCIGLGEIWRLEVGCDGTVRVDGTIQRGDRLGQVLTNATGSIPFEDWRAYGRASFEFAELIHGLAPHHAAGALLVLSVPSIEVIVEGDTMTLRCFDGRQLLQLADHIRRLDALPCLISASEPVAAPDDQATADRYLTEVAAAVTEMKARSYDKVVLSRSVEMPAQIDMPLSFHAGRSRNTPMRSYLLRDGSYEAYGFSPEMLLQADARKRVSTQPLAGTRACVGLEGEDRFLRDDLARDPKEIAEHAISVKVSLEEMRPLCEAKGLGISEFMDVCCRGSVQHLASRVQGTLLEGIGVWDAFLQLFPAVTVSGIPKVAALDAIRSHEPRPRGLYGGCVFTMDASGVMDAAVVLRSAFKDERGAWLQAGAGITAASSPERELEETREKLASVARFLRRR